MYLLFDSLFVIDKLMSEVQSLWKQNSQEKKLEIKMIIVIKQRPPLNMIVLVIEAKTIHTFRLETLNPISEAVIPNRLKKVIIAEISSASA